MTGRAMEIDWLKLVGSLLIFQKIHYFYFNYVIYKNEEVQNIKTHLKTRLGIGGLPILLWTTARL